MTRVLEVRDEVLLAEQKALIGRDFEVLTDEPQAGPDAPLVGRAEMDAPEADLLSLVYDSEARVGELVQVRVEDVDSQANLLCRAT